MQFLLLHFFSYRHVVRQNKSFNKVNKSRQDYNQQAPVNSELQENSQS